ncbi:glycoside hydrolase 43 family protein [Caulobacter flavus]|uniref:Glycoside hydrolase 43 family protein n=1 Tax=Caulobacter flavus TaxID=1679497 RepID=A0A2N5CUV7_9CAUL|nr:glycoside hydrolase family 43 protein [Caulobacter flavus]AYV49411.1 glycoside hydrolase 43 family protein [Caulobacter flavus]PLR17317.1 glycoside hydrolase 43 family protein [Caulobacter flavus]
MLRLALALSLLAGAAQAAPLAPGTAAFDDFVYSGRDPTDAPLAPGRYANPILKGFYPDPSVTRAGEDYYLVNSTFAWFPGIPVFHSKDLVNWTQIGNAIDRPGQLDFKRLAMSRAVFAPAITEHAGVFYILNTCVDCGGNFLVTARDPKGPWSDPVWLPQIDGIDTSLFFDDDGRGWIVNNGPPAGPSRYDGHRAISIQEYDPKAMTMVGPRSVLVDGGVDASARPIWIEGPHILKVDGRYYLTAAEGGTAEGHSQVVLRSDKVTGPYAPYAGNPILTQRDLPRDRAHPITSAGHADLVRTQSGEWWATFLAVRPYGDDTYNTGRETFLLPVAWKDGWPVILPPKTAIPLSAERPNLPAGPAPKVPTTGAFTVRETFDGQALGLDWMTMRIPAGRWWDLKDGALVLKARPDRLGGFEQPSIWARRQQHLDASAETTVRFAPKGGGDRAGIVALQNDAFFYALTVAGGEDGRSEVRLEKRAGDKDPVDGVVVARASLAGSAGGPVRLKITARGGRYDFAYAGDDGAWKSLAADQDGTILSTKVAGGFVGTMLGLYARADAR